MTRFSTNCAKIAFLAALGSLSGCMVSTAPLNTDEHASRLEADLQDAYALQEKIDHPLSLEEVTARAVKYNLDYRLKVMQEALAAGELGASRWDMLPQLTARAGYSNRSKPAASSSVNIDTGSITYSRSTSQDQDLRSASLGVAWNVLDFGVSYFQAKQQADRQLMARERRRKAVHTLLQEVRYAYWQAAGSAKLKEKVKNVLVDATAELLRIQQERKERLRPPLESLRQEKALLETIKQMQAILDELSIARPRLAALMGLPPGTAFELAEKELPSSDASRFNVPVEELEHIALKYRPELRESAYQERISALDVNKALARLLPGIQLTGSKEYTSNSFSAYNNWYEGGLNVAWNIMSLPSAPSRINAAKAGKSVARANTLALSMAVLSQVYISNQEYGSALKQYALNRKQREIEEQVLWYIRTGRSLDVVSQRDFIQAEANALKAELALYQSHAALEQARGNVYASIGLDPLPEIDADVSLERMTDTISRAFGAWSQGRFGWLDEERTRMSKVSELYAGAVGLFDREEYTRSEAAFRELLLLDPVNEPARQYTGILIPARLKSISCASELSSLAEQARSLEKEGRHDESRQMWNDIIIKAQKELQ
ncbi:MAG: TolC family protein [Chlorobiaceae bacterium]|nr:TolC family protein [Chlorobiaceae bacterium]